MSIKIKNSEKKSLNQAVFLTDWVNLVTLLITGQKMKAQELRIGNLVYWNEPKKLNVPHKVVLVSDDKIHTKPISLGETLSDYNPIPLTKEQLLRFGAVKDADGFYELTIGRKFFRISLDDMSVYYQSDIGLNGIILNADIDEVHLFQNLVFALTGEELPVIAPTP